MWRKFSTNDNDTFTPYRHSHIHIQIYLYMCETLFLLNSFFCTYISIAIQTMFWAVCVCINCVFLLWNNIEYLHTFVFVFFCSISRSILFLSSHFFWYNTTRLEADKKSKNNKTVCCVFANVFSLAAFLSSVFCLSFHWNGAFIFQLFLHLLIFFVCLRNFTSCLKQLFPATSNWIRIILMKLN